MRQDDSPRGFDSHTVLGRRPFEEAPLGDRKGANTVWSGLFVEE